MLSNNWHLAAMANTLADDPTASMIACGSRRELINSASTSYDRLSPMKKVKTLLSTTLYLKKEMHYLCKCYEKLTNAVEIRKYICRKNIYVPLNAEDLLMVTGDDECSSLDRGDIAPPTMGVDEYISRAL